jgi:hypothetical protein
MTQPCCRGRRNIEQCHFISIDGQYCFHYAYPLQAQIGLSTSHMRKERALLRVD